MTAHTPLTKADLLAQLEALHRRDSLETEDSPLEADDLLLASMNDPEIPVAYGRCNGSIRRKRP